jgi:hypothetical protein
MAFSRKHHIFQRCPSDDPLRGADKTAMVSTIRLAASYILPSHPHSHASETLRPLLRPCPEAKPSGLITAASPSEAVSRDCAASTGQKRGDHGYFGHALNHCHSGSRLFGASADRKRTASLCKLG